MSLGKEEKKKPPTQGCEGGGRAAAGSEDQAQRLGQNETVPCRGEGGSGGLDF